MSGINQIRIYYGQGEVVNGPSRADLGPFPHITVDHPHPKSASIRDLKDWFMAMFQLDANLCSVTVHCLYITGINPVVYELDSNDGTSAVTVFLSMESLDSARTTGHLRSRRD